MKLKFLQNADKYIGTSISLFIYLIIKIFKPNKKNIPKNIKSFLFIKLLGGGNIFIALPYFYSLKEQYPDCKLKIICSNKIYNFVENSKIFDEIYLINIDNLFKIFLDTIKVILKTKKVDVLINLEPYSNFTNILSSIIKKNFYLTTNLKNNKFYTNLADKIILFNSKTPVFETHQKIFNLFKIYKMEKNKVKNLYIEKNKYKTFKNKIESIGIIPFCSHLSKERKISNHNWSKILSLISSDKILLYIFGDNSEHFLAKKLAKSLNEIKNIDKIILLTKNYNFNNKIQIMLNLDKIYSIDTGYNHIARILNKKLTSYWGASDPKLMLDKNFTSNEIINYSNLSCSPCVHINNKLPCDGNNICMEIDKNKLDEKIKKASWLINDY